MKTWKLVMVVVLVIAGLVFIRDEASAVKVAWESKKIPWVTDVAGVPASSSATLEARLDKRFLRLASFLETERKGDGGFQHEQ